MVSNCELWDREDQHDYAYLCAAEGRVHHGSDCGRVVFLQYDASGV